MNRIEIAVAMDAMDSLTTRELRTVIEAANMLIAEREA